MKKLSTVLATVCAFMANGQNTPKEDFSNFIPQGYTLYESISGDLNQDGLADKVLVIKGTDKNQIINNESRGQWDRNRRGIIILFKQENQYQAVLNNYDCFSSENEDGGIYYAPELSVEINNNKLYIHYAHGRYGYWQYTFRYQNSDFELIGYDRSYRSNYISDTVNFDEISINFLTQKKLIKEVIRASKKNKVHYKKTWQRIEFPKLIQLSKIKDFDELDTDF